MDKKEKKKLMTRVAKREITMKEADILIKPKKVDKETTVGEIEGKGNTSKKTKTRKLNTKGGKK